jgi:Flp pilus assembly protein TadG
MPSVLRARGRNRREQRGAVAVEAALVTSLLVIPLVLGIIEFSLILRDYVAVSSVVRVGARIASANPGSGPGGVCDTTTVTPVGTPKFAACAANAIQQAGTAMPQDSIDYIMVYQANKNGYPAPTGTAATAIQTNTASTAPSPTSTTPCTPFANCVAYRWLDASNSFAYSSGTWASATVDACPTSAYNVGVWMHATHQNVTSFFGRTKGMSDKTVMKFEPLSTTSCNAAAPSPHQ